MATLADLLIKLGADTSDLDKELKHAQKQLKSAFGSDALSLSNDLAVGFAGLAAGLGAVAVASVKMASDMAVTKKSFTTLMGNAQLAEQFLNDLAQFAADTPFELAGLTTASKKMLAFGFAAQDIIPIMTAIGDAAALLGVGQEGIDRITLALGQMNAKGKVSAEEMNQLAETGIPVWQMLADAIGTDIPTAMKMAENGAVSGVTGINAIVTGMQTKFKGGMEGLSKEIPGLFSTIKDNAATAARYIGDKIIAGLDIKAKLQTVSNALSNFASYIQTNGLKEALVNLIPAELTAAVFALSGALIAAAIPAMIAFALSVWTAIAPLAPFLAVGAAVGLLAYEIWKNWEPLGTLFSGLMSGISATFQLFWGSTKALFYTGVQTILTTLQPLANLIGGELSAAVSSYLDGLQAKVDAASQSIKDAGAQLNAAAATVSKGFSGVSIGAFNKGISSLGDGVKKVYNSFTGLHSAASAAAAAAGSAASGAGSSASSAANKAAKAIEELKKKAEQVHKSIYQEWVQTTNTSLQQLDAWKAKQTKSLEETKSANENYQQDVTMLQATYAAKRLKIEQETAEKIRNIQSSISNLSFDFKEMQIDIMPDGVDKDLAELKLKYEKTIDEIEKKYDELAAKYVSSTDVEKAAMEKSLSEKSIAYKKTEQGNLDFTEQINAENLAAAGAHYNKLKALKYEETKYKEELDKAYNTGNITAYQTLVNDQRGLEQQSLEGKKAYMDTYLKLWKSATQTAQELWANAVDGMTDNLSTFLTDTISFSDDIKSTWSDFGKNLVKTIVGVYAKMYASRIAFSLTGKVQNAADVANTTTAQAQATAATVGAYTARTAAATAYYSAVTAAQAAALTTQTTLATTVMATLTAASTVMAAAVAAAWAPAAAMVSLATMGANSESAIAGMTAAVAAATALAVPKMATGGSVSGDGTSTSDSILSWLSNGEYVIKAAAVDKFGVGFFNALNNGQMPKLASGGIVATPTLAQIGQGRYPNTVPIDRRNSVSPTNSGGGTAITTTQNIYGDINTEADLDKINKNLVKKIKYGLMGAS
ncbi:MAG: putative tail length tape measure protein [Firmicutes bacterium]|nr:putative tail length tape measure protein [Bacillota bacterium]